MLKQPETGLLEQAAATQIASALEWRKTMSAHTNQIDSALVPYAALALRVGLGINYVAHSLEKIVHINRPGGPFPAGAVAYF